MMKRYCAILCIAFLLAAVTLVPARAPLAADDDAPRADSAPKTDSKDSGKTSDSDTDDNPSKPKKDGPKDVSGGRFVGDPVYVHLAPMVMPVISDDGVEQIVTFQIDIEVKDFDVADHIHTIMPRVVDALMQSLYGGLGQGSLRRGKLVDVSKVKAKATAALDNIIGPDNIRDVLIQGVAQRML